MIGTKLSSVYIRLYLYVKPKFELHVLTRVRGKNSVFHTRVMSVECVKGLSNTNKC